MPDTAAAGTPGAGNLPTHRRANRFANWPTNWPLVVLALALALPSMLFWLPNPQPARHFIIPLLGLYLLLGQFWSARLQTQKQALIWGLGLVLANQLAAELARPLIIKGYQWSYSVDGGRRATQQVPLGLYPLDQAANQTGESGLRQEAIKLAEKKPARLLILADNQHYMIAHLLARDPALRLSKTRVGRFDALLLQSPVRQLYLVEKYTMWPSDVLAEVQALPEFEAFPLYVQKATISRHDKTLPLPARAFGL